MMRSQYLSRWSAALLSLSLATCQPSKTPADRRTPVVIDTDMGTDDAMAIVFLLGRPDVEVRAITVTGAGLAHCEPGLHNALRLLALANHADIPVACGRTTPSRATMPTRTSGASKRTPSTVSHSPSRSPPPPRRRPCNS